MNKCNRWQVVKDGISIAICSSPEEADDFYAMFDADEIREVYDDSIDLDDEFIQDSSRYMFMLAGAPGSGKSTLAMKICHYAEMCGLAPVSPNDICEADQYFIKLGHGQYAFDAAKLPEAHAWCEHKAQHAMHLKHSLIVSNTNILPQHRLAYFKLAKMHSYKVVFLHLTSEFKSIHNVPMEVIERMKANYAPLTAYECSLALSPSEMSPCLTKLLDKVNAMKFVEPEC